MHFKITSNERTYRVQFRLAVVCQVTEQKPTFRYLSHWWRAEAKAVQNPVDDFNLYTGAKLAFQRVLKDLKWTKEDRQRAWQGFFNLTRPWVKVR